MSKIRDTIQHAWNAFQANENNPLEEDFSYGGTVQSMPDRTVIRLSNERSVITPILNRLAIDVASIDIRHARVDDNENFQEELKSGLTDCLKFSANIDQTPSAFKRDIAYTMFEEGVAVVVPVDTTVTPLKTTDPAMAGGYDIKSMRVGSVKAWYPKHVRVSLYNERIGQREEITVPKSICAIIENPLYSVMNEPNSTLKRLLHKLNLLDKIDNEAGSGKLNMIIQLPYVVKSEARKKQAEQRREDLELQLNESKFGIAYTDGTEKITQLNRPVENDLPSQVESLTKLLYNQLGLTQGIIDGTASEQELLNYRVRTLKPIMKAIVEAFTRTFLTKTAITQGQRVIFITDPFELVPVANIAEIADKFTRNEVLSSNEIRSTIGFKPSDDPKADELRNSNMPQPESPQTQAVPMVEPAPGGVDVADLL